MLIPEYLVQGNRESTLSMRPHLNNPIILTVNSKNSSGIQDYKWMDPFKISLYRLHQPLWIESMNTTRVHDTNVCFRF